jgi:TatD DNase family protein
MIDLNSRLIFDSHAHYDDEAFDTDRDELLQKLPELGICRVVNIGSDLTSSEASVRLAAQYPYIYAAVGIHPECAGDVPQNYLEQLKKLLAMPKVVAIGEIGLDYHFDDGPPRDVQKQVFESQLMLAKEYDLPVVVHNREAHGDTMELLRRYRPKGVVHCYSGSVEMARELVSMGIYIGLGGAVTFKNARTPVEVAASIPLDRLLNETDCPYMSPVPYRGKRCDSSLIPYSAAKIAEVRSTTAEEILAAGKHNAAKLYKIPLEGS